ncbi:MAG TPA: DUF2784 domain-containing protein [Fimbriiglobus sp.]|jgi:hypothetical protein|nr:DUF2784 domain-containing protein [Fimbriiglobus sp.]
MYGYLADLMVFVHLMYVGYVLVGQLAIIVASAFQWQWGRNRWFRLTHLLAIGIVALEAVMGWQCPLTKWEHQLRELAGQKFDGSETFMGRIVHSIMFPTGPGGQALPEVFFTMLYIAMLIIVVQGLVMYPPRLRPSRRSDGELAAVPASA